PHNTPPKQKTTNHPHTPTNKTNKPPKKNNKTNTTNHTKQNNNNNTPTNPHTTPTNQPPTNKNPPNKTNQNNPQKHPKPNQKTTTTTNKDHHPQKGPSHVRGGTSDRIEMIQNNTNSHFTDAQHEHAVTLPAEGAPTFKEASWFTIPEGVEFDGAEPWRPQLI
ncbi:regulatory protein NosR, partial [Neisseria sp. P0021.S006]